MSSFHLLHKHPHLNTNSLEESPRTVHSKCPGIGAIFKLNSETFTAIGPSNFVMFNPIIIVIIIIKTHKM